MQSLLMLTSIDYACISKSRCNHKILLRKIEDKANTRISFYLYLGSLIKVTLSLVVRQEGKYLSLHDLNSDEYLLSS